MLTAKLSAQEIILQVLQGSIIVEERKQHNLVLTNASNLMAAYRFENLSAYAALGTSSTAPAAGQTALVAEIARTLNQGGGVDGISRISPGVYEVIKYREFTEAQVGGQNITEWGFGPLPGAGSQLISRELFRDGGNVPTPVTPAADQRVRLIYKTRITLGPVVPTAASINITGVGVRTGQFQLIGASDLESQIAFGAFNDLWTFNQMAAAASLPLTCKPILTTRPAFTYNQTGLSADSLSDAAVSVGAYTNNSKTRSTGTTVFGAAQGNGSIVAFFIGSPYPYNSNTRYAFGGVLFVLDVGQELAKLNTQRLTLQPWSVSWT